MPLNPLCTSSGNKRGSFSTSSPFILASVQTEEKSDVQSKPPMERCESLTSTLSFSKDICRICHCEEGDDMPLIGPCLCSGSLRFVHQSCLQQWIKSSDTKSCELCKFPFSMHTQVKPFRKWEHLDMTGLERRKILCSVAFHVIAITCVVWSLYILIERTSQDIRIGELKWTFYTKLIVVAVGVTGSFVFMYFQCRTYFNLCRRWRAFNRIIYVKNAPEKIPLAESEKSLTNKESSRSPLNSSSEVEKPFLGLAVITSTTSTDPSSLSTLTYSTTSTGAVCICTASSPPGAIWAEEISPPPQSTFSYFNSGLPNRKRGPLETENLISNTEKLPTREENSEVGRNSLGPPRVVHTPNNSFRSRSEDGSDASDLETLHLDPT